MIKSSFGGWLVEWKVATEKLDGSVATAEEEIKEAWAATGRIWGSRRPTSCRIWEFKERVDEEVSLMEQLTISQSPTGLDEEFDNAELEEGLNPGLRESSSDGTKQGSIPSWSTTFLPAERSGR